jgi:hypothetical protein
MPSTLNYAVPGLLTTLSGIDSVVMGEVGSDPVETCRPVASLVIQPDDARALGLPQDRFATSQIRPAAELVRHLLAPDRLPPRDPGHFGSWARADTSPS